VIVSIEQLKGDIRRNIFQMFGKKPKVLAKTMTNTHIAHRTNGQCITCHVVDELDIVAI
jgi:hypothetical protein